MRNLIAFLLVICSTLIFSCKRDKGVMCTMEYRMLSVSIKDTASRPVVLSSYYVKKTSTGQILDHSEDDSVYSVQGIYFVCTDGDMGMTSKTGTEFVFHGMLDSVEVVRETYIIGNDECHVKMLSGNTEIIIAR